MASVESRSGLNYGWALGESGWNTGTDDNWKRLGRFGFHLSVKDRHLTAPPGAPAAGDTYIVGAGATGAWAGEENNVALWDGAAWVFAVPRTGWLAFLEDEVALTAFNAGAWGPAGSASGSGTSPVDLGGSFLGAPGGGAEVLALPMVRTLTFPANFASSKAIVRVAPAADATFTIKKDSGGSVTNVGTITFAAGSKNGVFASSGEQVYNTGDVLIVTAPGVADASLSGLGFNLSATR